jgi:hypothetical protein
MNIRVFMPRIIDRSSTPRQALFTSGFRVAVREAVIDLPFGWREPQAICAYWMRGSTALPLLSAASIAPKGAAVKGS